MGRRAADVAPVWPVAHAAGLQYVRDIWADSKIKRAMDRAVQAKHLGVEDVLAAIGNEEVPGEINIKGDEVHTHQHFYPPAPVPAEPAKVEPPQQPAAVQTPVQTPAQLAATPAAPAATPTPLRQRVRNRLMGFVVPALIGGGLVGGTMLFNYLTDKPDSVTTITQPGGKFEYRYGIEQRPTPQ